ncbi:MAG: M23 family metallopeptidase, partial [Spirochaetaceae bacterium]|nr:M23 family metallopeptidase [Spirochaetaceae bacterium]
MGILRPGICILLLFLAVCGFAQEQIHVVRQGDTVYSLSRRYGVGVEEILSLNGIADPRRIREGQRLRIPRSGTEQAAPDAGGYLEYRAVRGDSLYALARRHGTTMDAIRQASGLAADHVLKVGDRLRIPRETPVAGSPATGSPAAPGSGPTRTTTPAAAPDPSTPWPVRAREVSYMTGRSYGVVILGQRSEPVKSLTQGTVISAGPYRGFGRVAIVQMTGGYFYVYGGCESLSVKEGDRVA